MARFWRSGGEPSVTQIDISAHLPQARKARDFGRSLTLSAIQRPVHPVFAAQHFGRDFGLVKPKRRMTFSTPGHRMDISIAGVKKTGGIFEETSRYRRPTIGEITADGILTRPQTELCLCTRNDYVQSWAISKDSLTGTWARHQTSSAEDSLVSRLKRSPLPPSTTVKTAIFSCSLHNPREKQEKPRQIGRWERGYEGADRPQPVETPPSIGGMGFFCLDDPEAGPALFRLTDQVKARSYEIDRTRRIGRPRKVCFGEQGEKLATLSVGSSETAEVDDVSVIFAAQQRAMDCSEEIFVWKRAKPVAEKRSKWNMIVWGLKSLVVLGFLAFVYQNLEPMFRFRGVRRMVEGLPHVIS
ncbi:hypothetical protein C8F04DRAFT_1199646 [Mycena alexandri]|uniref:Uncharacterized protein n=1 Tax=Mycena alexandri TaxID=1745969 RepID=A0AAD6RZS4_9AGAR|nr:hypothetical protein C8F04DRAFT_1199646 [Mycena alexandri]